MWLLFIQLLSRFSVFVVVVVVIVVVAVVVHPVIIIFFIGVGDATASS